MDQIEVSSRGVLPNVPLVVTIVPSATGCRVTIKQAGFPDETLTVANGHAQVLHVAANGAGPVQGSSGTTEPPPVVEPSGGVDASRFSGH